MAQVAAEAVRCPTCRLEPTTPPTCRRCGTDLRELMAVAAQARQLAAHAFVAFAAGDGEAAAALASRARSLHGGGEAGRLAQLLANTLCRAVVTSASR